jgi:ribose transport system substrate-binding protein
LPGLLGQSEATPTVAHTKPTIPVIVKDKTSFYWQVMLAGARKAGQDLKINVLEVGADSDSDIDGQIKLLENAVASSPAAIVIAPVQFAALGKPIDAAARKTKIVAVDSEVGSKGVTSLLKTDNIATGRMAADSLATTIRRTYGDAEGAVAIITGLTGSPWFDQCSKAFKEQLAAKYGALQIVADKVADARASRGFDLMADLISAHPELRGVFASNRLMTEGVAQALADNNMTNKTGDLINIVGFDCDDKLLTFLQDGVIAALVVQDPFRMGYDGVKTAVIVSNGGHAPTYINTGAHVITMANLNSPSSQGFLYPKI